MDKIEQLLANSLPEIEDHSAFNEQVLTRIKKYERYQSMIFWVNVMLALLATVFAIPFLLKIEPIFSSLLTSPVSVSLEQATASGAELLAIAQSPIAMMAMISAFVISVIIKMES